MAVALFTRAWIEILSFVTMYNLALSPSSRGRGLKLNLREVHYDVADVVLFTRAWIEIDLLGKSALGFGGAHFTRAWIEMAHSVGGEKRAWIEMMFCFATFSGVSRRPLHEGVD